MFFFFFFFEQSVIDIIEQALHGDESLVAGEIEEDYAYDYYLPNGCKSLGLPPKTALEVKKELVPGIYSILFSDARKALEKGVCNEFVVVYEKSPWDHVSYKIPKDVAGHFKFLSYEELKKWADSHDIKPKEKDWKADRELRLKKLSNEIWFGQNTLFLGAGLSASLGVPGWESLLKRLLTKLRRKRKDLPVFKSISKDCDDSYLVIARYINDLAKQNNMELVSEIRPLLYKNKKNDSDFLSSIVELLKLNRVGEVITYNYDTLLEKRMNKDEISNTSIDSQSRRMKNAIPVMHVHGIISMDDIALDSNVVLSEEKYHDLYRDSYHWANVAQLYALTHTTCIFAGLSMKDPSLRRLLDIANSQGTKDVNHYAFLIRDEFDCHKETEAMFSQMGVNIIWCEDRDDVPAQINEVVRLTDRKQIYNPVGCISGRHDSSENQCG